MSIKEKIIVSDDSTRCCVNCGHLRQVLIELFEGDWLDWMGGLVGLPELPGLHSSQMI